VDYSARSVIVVGPDLKLHECGLPKDMAAELYKPFIIRKMIERGIVKTVKSAKKIVDKKEPVVWDILENVLKGHPVLLNRAPTLHRLGIQAFQPKLIEGKAIRLHPLVTTAFNADFDGDQMAVHLPLGNAAILEAQLLMLASHNILNPANGVLGLYYMTKGKVSTETEIVKGEGKTFYSPEEVIIAYNERKLDLHAPIKVKTFDLNEQGVPVLKMIETTCGRVLFNEKVPREAGFINDVLTKKALRDIIGEVLKVSGTSRTAQFLDDIKNLGYSMAFKGGLSFNLDNIIIPKQKSELVAKAEAEVLDVMENYRNGFITNNERYNQIIDIWTHTNSRLTQTLMDQLKADRQGFNPIYMMFDSGARGSREQIRQLSGMRGLMAKPQKSGATTQEIIENPILSNFKEGLSILEYFISTHGARKGLADTALKTADAGYLTRRLVDVAQDVVINSEDCGTLRGIVASALKKSDEVIEPLYDRILGRTSVHDVFVPDSDRLIVASGELITEDVAKEIESNGIEEVEIRSVLTCEMRKGVCAKCYGRNLSTHRPTQIGDAVGVIAAQSIGEPGTQLTLRTFHVGGTASNIADSSDIKAKHSGKLEFEELRTIDFKGNDGTTKTIVVGRSGEVRVIDEKTGIVLMNVNIPYGSDLMINGQKSIKKGDVICKWDPYNALIITEVKGKVLFKDMEPGITYREEMDEQTGFDRIVIIESRDKRRNPAIHIVDPKSKETMREYSLPVGANVMVKNGVTVEAGETLVKIPRTSGKSGDITGGLPRVTELFEARNPSNPAVVSEIDGTAAFGTIKRGNREIIITPKSGEPKKYLVPLSKHILVQQNDFVRAGSPLSDGAITPNDILNIEGPTKVQEYIVNEIQEVYRLQGVKINDKHFEVIVRQMMLKAEIIDAGDTRFLEGQSIHKADIMEANDALYGMMFVRDAGDSTEVEAGQIISVRKFRDENSKLKREDKALIEAREANPATSTPLLQGITRASLQTQSFISAASFQETTKVLNEAAISGKEDHLLGLKENVIVGHLIPAGTGVRAFQKMIVGSKEVMEKLTEGKED
jgi:DNA-directed RNA polymerase subunit beta'